MHAVVVRYTGQTGQLDDLIRHSTEVTLPAARGVRGLLGRHLLVNRDTHRVVALSYYQLAEDARAVVEHPSYQESRASRHFAVGQVDTRIYEVPYVSPTADWDRARWARLVSYQLQPGRMAERVRLAEEREEASRAIPGRVGAYVLADRATEHSLVLGLWSGAQEMRASEQHEAARGWPSQHGLAAGDVAVEHYEVAHRSNN